MTGKKAAKRNEKGKLAVKKETLRDLSPNQSVRAGFIMQDSRIVPTSRR